MARPRRLVGVSTKMYFGFQQTKDYVESIVERLSTASHDFNDIDIFIIPDFVSLSEVARMVRPTQLLVGAQDCFHEDKGPYTGEVSSVQLREVGCKIVELGHAERRRLFGETDEVTGKKAAAVSKNGMIPLVCVGEKTNGDVELAVEECKVQIEAVIKAVPDGAEIIFAYEPVWAIGQAEPAGAERVVAVTKRLRVLTQGRTGTVRFVYGGSAGPGLFDKLSEGVDGLFLGRFAHNPVQFLSTIDEIAPT